MTDVTFDQFMNVIKGINTPPQDYFKSRMVDAVKTADPGVHAAFFPAENPPAPPPPGYDTNALNAALAEFANKYASYVLSTVPAYGFNAAIAMAGFNPVNDWFQNHGSLVGQDMLLDLLNANGLAAFFSDPAPWAGAIAAKVSTAEFFTDLMVESHTRGSVVVPRVLLLVLKTLDRQGANFQAVLNAWKTYNFWNEIADYETFAWMAGVADFFQQSGGAYNDVHGAVAAACALAGPPYEWSSLVSEGKFSTTYHYARTTYGAAVAAWLDSGGGPKAYGLRSGSAPNNVITTSDAPGCVLADTPILLANGTWKPIDGVHEGQAVLSANGQVSICSSEKIVNRHLKWVYGINDDAPFMSLEHAVLTQRGWGCPNPQLARQINPHLEVHILAVGDVVLKVAHVKDGHITYRKEVVQKINIMEVEPGAGLVGMDLHFREGHPSYHAKGYCCLLNYPELTIQSIAANVMTYMNPRERLEFRHQLQGISPLLEKALGSHSVNAFSEMLEDPARVAPARHTDARGVIKRYHRGAADLLMPAMRVQAASAEKPLPAGFEKLAFMHGHLFINDTLVKTASHEKHITWQRTLQNGTQESGLFQMLPHGLMGSGVIRQGTSTIPFQAGGQLDYSVSYSADGKTVQWPAELQVGFSNAKGAMHVSAALVVPGDAQQTANLNGASMMFFSVINNPRKQAVLSLNMECSPNYCTLTGWPWLSAEIEFNMNYSQFNGVLYAYDASQPDNRAKQSYPVTGIFKNSAGLHSMQQAITAQWLAQPANAAPQTSAHAAPLFFNAADLASADGLSKEKLYTLPAPDMSLVHQTSFAKMKTLMLYVIEDDWLQFFGETRPVPGSGVLSQADADLVNNDKEVHDFLVNAFAVGYLTQSFSSSDNAALKSKFQQMAGLQDKLNYFWKGAGKTSLGKDPGYNKLTARLLSNTYVESVPGLADYLKPENNPADWALQLYTYCTTEPTQTGLALNNTLDGRALITHLTTMLHVLDPQTRLARGNKGDSVSYATALYQAIVDVRMAQVVNNITPTSHEDMVEFLTRFFQQYFASLLQGDKWSDEIRAVAQKEINDLMVQNGVTTVNDLVASMGSIIADFGDMLIQLQGKPFITALQAFAKKYPKLAAVGQGMVFAFYAYSLFNAVQTFQNWGHLKTPEKIQVIVNLVETLAEIFRDGSRLWAARTLAKLDASLQETLDAMKIIQDIPKEVSITQETPLLGEGVIEDAPLSIEEVLSGAGRVASADLTAAQAGEELARAAARWENIAKVTGAFAQAMTVLALAAACVCTGFAIQNDFDTGQSPAIEALDIISEISNGVAFLAEGGATIAVMAGVEVCSAIPVVGFIAAAVGVIISLILMFLPRTPPPSPAEVFVDAHSAPFVTNLLVPPQDWLDAQKRVTDHLDQPAKGSGTSTSPAAMPAAA